MHKCLRSVHSLLFPIDHSQLHVSWCRRIAGWPFHSLWRVTIPGVVSFGGKSPKLNKIMSRRFAFTRRENSVKNMQTCPNGEAMILLLVGFRAMKVHDYSVAALQDISFTAQHARFLLENEVLGLPCPASGLANRFCSFFFSQRVSFCQKINRKALKTKSIRLFFCSVISSIKYTPQLLFSRFPISLFSWDQPLPQRACSRYERSSVCFPSSTDQVPSRRE